MKELRSIGIQPDAIICRSDFEVSDGIRDKIALFCDVQKDAVIPLLTVDSIYRVPLILEEWKLGDLLFAVAESAGGRAGHEGVVGDGGADEDANRSGADCAGGEVRGAAGTLIFR